MSYSALTATSGITSFPVMLSIPLTVPKLVIDLDNLVPNKSHWIRAGAIRATIITNIGPVSGKTQYLNFGTTELTLDVPDYPYFLSFAPRDYITRWALTVYTRDGYDQPEIPIVQCIDSINPTFDEGYE